MYRPIQEARWFNASERYSEVDWGNFSRVVDSFSRRLEQWYIEPTSVLLHASGHFGFPVVALTSVLVDTLSQYEMGVPASHRQAFMDFISSRMPRFTGALPHPIRTREPNGKSQTLENIEEVLYFGFRCGVIHEAHIPLYGAIHGNADPVEIHEHGLAEYTNGDPCPTVVVNPELYFEGAKDAYAAYLADLRCEAPKNGELRTRFARKVESSFGVTIAP